ncbi:hypothetical protein [Enterobacter sp. HSTU-ASh6]|uniref:hypothetical protein n=1 Tax=Enterobacter sp. HSTU-ASh6 TaxID=2678687 RepID=UPI00224F937A|nr:hypothetical protein [Enterobacter sp. HSTU-ASh6]MCX4180999.1 hypothetical protein [Enterobacter sp. HSTU-ASh6]
MNVKALETKYGLIYGRDALIVSGTELKLYPFNFLVKASLSLSSCKPGIKDAPDVRIEFSFSNIEMMSVYKIDDYPYDGNLQSSFDLIETEREDDLQRLVLSTYDHVFDIIGKCEVNYL